MDCISCSRAVITVCNIDSDRVRLADLYSVGTCTIYRSSPAQEPVTVLQTSYTCYREWRHIMGWKRLLLSYPSRCVTVSIRILAQIGHDGKYSVKTLPCFAVSSIPFPLFIPFPLIFDGQTP